MRLGTAGKSRFYQFFRSYRTTRFPHELDQRALGVIGML
jgi:hypothetical protein